jgi:hypothetical protein
MEPNPQQSDPQFQSPYQPDTEQQTQTGMQSQPNATPPTGGNVNANAQPYMPGTGQVVNANSIVPGANVYGMDGKKVGTVQEVYQDSFLVQKGIFFLHDYYVPLRYVGRTTNDEINLTVTGDEAQRQDWRQQPDVGAGSGAQAMPTTQPGQPQQGPSSTGPAAGSTSTQRPQTTPDYGTNYGTPPTGTTPTPGRTPLYGNYGEAGRSDTMQDATNRGVQNDQSGLQGDLGTRQSDLGGPRESVNPDLDLGDSDVEGARDL